MSHNSALRLRDRRLRRAAAYGTRQAGAALDAVQHAERIAEVLRDVRVCLAAAAPRRGVGRRGGRIRFLAVCLMVVNAAAAVLMLAMPVPSAYGPHGSTLFLAMLLGAVLGGAETAFAIAVGTGLREVRQDPAGPPRARRQRERAVLAEGVALALLSIPVGWAIFVWTRDRVAPGHEQLAALLGMALALQAWLAPWLLVVDAAQALPTRRRCRQLQRRAARLTARWERACTTATLALAAADSALAFANRIVAEASGSVPASWAASWALSVRRLAAAVDSATEACAGLPAAADHEPPCGPVERGDVDVAG